jgi:hypothetical protein
MTSSGRSLRSTWLLDGNTATNHLRKFLALKIDGECPAMRLLRSSAHIILGTRNNRAGTNEGNNDEQVNIVRSSNDCNSLFEKGRNRTN